MKRTLTLTSLALTLAAAVACGDTNNFVNEAPPPGGAVVGAGGAPPGGYGYGANASSGQGGMVEPPPPMCDDAFKRCAHSFTLPFNGESSVEVRGDWKLTTWDVGVPMNLDGDTWRAEVDVPWDDQVLYKFIIDGVWQPDPTNPNQVDDGFGSFNSVLAPTTCEDDFTCDVALLGDFDWRDAVLYFVFVDRFNNGDPGNDGQPIAGVPTSTNFQGGDWEGVTQKIEEGYFTDLGVNTLWLSVPMDNTESSGVGTGDPNSGPQNYSAYHGYWPTDLSTHESRFGTMADLKALVDTAHANDIKVIVDYAMNHVHADSPIYQQNPDWFWPLYDGSRYCVCGADCGWDGDDGRRCWFTDYLPDFNFQNAQARQFSVDNALWWIQELGLDGYRLDAVKHIEDQWILDLRARVTAEIEPQTEQHFYMVGETFTGDKNTIAYYVNPTTMLDGQFDFPLRHAIVSSLLIRNQSMFDLESFLVGNDGFYGAGIMSTFVGNHDVPRNIHFAQDTPLWGDAWANGKDRNFENEPGLPSGTSAFQRVANGFTVIFTIPGVPLIYYGDEIGLPGAGDPDNRRFMQWSGYSAGQTLLKDHIAQLSAIRADHPALRKGSRTTLDVSNDVLAYRMQGEGDDVVVIINRGDGTANANNIPSGNWTDLLDASSHGGGSVSVPARSSRILVQP